MISPSTPSEFSPTTSNPYPITTSAYLSNTTRRIYKQNTKFHKDPHFYATLGFPTASVCITDPHQHRARREILNPFFSKRTIAALSSVLHTTIEKLCTNIAAIHGAVPLQDAFHCMTVDIISGYAFGTSFNMLDEPDFNAVHVRSVERSAETQWLIKHIPAIRWLADRLPGPLGSWLDGGLMELAGVRSPRPYHIHSPFLTDKRRLVKIS